MTTATPPLARAGDPVTSHRAAASIRPHLSDLQAAILRVLRMTFELHGRGMTDRELCGHKTLATRPDGQPRRAETIRGRRKELVDAGYVVASGEIRERCTVWVPVPRPDAGRLF